MPNKNGVRCESRIPHRERFQILCHGQTVDACTENLSHKGLCAEIFGPTSVGLGEVLKISLETSGDIKAKVVWTNGSYDSLTVGLQILESVSEIFFH